MPTNNAPTLPVPEALVFSPRSPDDDEPVVYATPARVVSLDAERAAGAPTRDALMEKVLGRAIDPDFLRENPPYFWTAEISSSRVDSYFTVMQDSTLRNFARDAEAGVSFQNSHNVRSLPFGASLSGRFYAGRGDKHSRTDADFYTVPGLRTNEVSTDDLIRGIKSGIIRDVSVGFHGGRTMCSICDRDMDAGFLDWLFGGSEENVCLHFPGETYDLTNEAGKKTGEKAMCLGRIEDAGLAEVSAVYKGATPNAGVHRAIQASEAGKLPPDVARRLETRLRIKLPASHHVWSPAAPDARLRSREQPQENDMPTNENTDSTPQTRSGDPGTILTPAVRAALEKMGFTPAADNAASLEDSLRAAAEEVTRLRAREEELSPLADVAASYRADLINEAVTQGKRALGVTFPEETYRSLLATAGIEQIKVTRDTFRDTANAIVTPGAHVDATRSDDTPEGEATPKKAGIPDSAFRSGR